MGQSWDAYQIMLAGLTNEVDGAKEHYNTYKKECAEAGIKRYADAGGCPKCCGRGYYWETYGRHQCGCEGKGDVDTGLLRLTEDESRQLFGLNAAHTALKSELASWKPRIIKDDLVMYCNERARAKFTKDGPQAGEKVPCYTCGIVFWINFDHRLGVEVISGEHIGMKFFTSVANVKHVNTWKKVMEKESIAARLAEYTPKLGDWVTCRIHYGKVIRLLCLRGTDTLGVFIRTPGGLRYSMPAHECRKSEPMPTNMLETLETM